jgi:hypothetical protein
VTQPPGHLPGRRARSRVAGVALAVPVGVELVRVRDERAVVYPVGDPVVVVVGIAGVADAVAIRVDQTAAGRLELRGVDVGVGLDHLPRDPDVRRGARDAGGDVRKGPVLGPVGDPADRVRREVVDVDVGLDAVRRLEGDDLDSHRWVRE